MPAEPLFRNDKLESLVRKCVVFPADGSETRLVHMIARTVTDEDISSLRTHSRCVDMASTFGDEYRKTHLAVHQSAQGRHDGVRSTYHYLVFYNLSPNLPINLNVARLIGVTPSHLKTKRRLFWRGDVVAMKVQPESEVIDFIVKSLDADLSALGPLQEFLREEYQKGSLEHGLHFDEEQWNWYVAEYCGPSSLLLGPSKSYWGANAVEQEENFLGDLNELRCVIGRPPLPRHAYMKSRTEYAVTLFKSAFRQKVTGPPKKVTGPPKLPPKLERQIFEMCALESPEFCTVLVLIARRVHAWIDSILIATVYTSGDYECKRLKQFLAKLTNSGRPVEYYAQHVKNLAILGITRGEDIINDVLTICTGVENLVLLPSYRLDLFKNPQAGRNLRRLTIKLSQFSEPHQRLGYTPHFYHPCFANLTHLHICDEYWPDYAGWETLVSLTHLAFACSGPPAQVMQLMQKLPTVRYVALGSYKSGEMYKYASATVDNSPHIRAAWGERIVFISEIPEHDWERGARGEDDFWDLVEQEVARRLEEGSVG